MAIGRRALLKLLGGAALVVSGLSGLLRRVAPTQAQSGLALRKVRPGDAADLQAIMSGCVTDADSFHGKCDGFSLRWAEVMARRRPESVVITLDGVPVAFQEIPSIGPPVEPLAEDADEEEQEKFRLRDLNRRTFRLTAAGVRADLLEGSEAVEMFRRILFYGARHARELGYEYVECVAPWQKHPRLPKAWTEYRGCELTEPVSVSEVDGREAYWLRWRLVDMIDELEIEGAGREALDAL
jgi:hypothetical protein